MKKVFITGLSKTSTKSMTRFINESCMLNIKHYPINNIEINNLLKSKKKEDLDVLYKIDGMSDIQVCPIYELVDKNIDAVFIHTYRDISSWLTSYKKHISIRPIPDDNTPKKFLREEVYGTIKFDKAKLEDAFCKYEKNIREYFLNKENFIEINIKEKNKEEKIYKFLNSHNFKIYKKITYPWLGKSK